MISLTSVLFVHWLFIASYLQKRPSPIFFIYLAKDCHDNVHLLDTSGYFSGHPLGLKLLLTQYGIAKAPIVIDLIWLQVKACTAPGRSCYLAHHAPLVQAVRDRQNQLPLHEPNSSGCQPGPSYPSSKSFFLRVNWNKAISDLTPGNSLISPETELFCILWLIGDAGAWKGPLKEPPILRKCLVATILTKLHLSLFLTWWRWFENRILCCSPHNTSWHFCLFGAPGQHSWGVNFRMRQ